MRTVVCGPLSDGRTELRALDSGYRHRVADTYPTVEPTPEEAALAARRLAEWRDGVWSEPVG